MRAFKNLIESNEARPEREGGGEGGLTLAAVTRNRAPLPSYLGCGNRIHCMVAASSLPPAPASAVTVIMFQRIMVLMAESNGYCHRE
jgi:hypothetical protein